MINKDKNPSAIEDMKNPEIFSDEKTDEKIHRHLSDKNDQITDQDIKAVKTDFDEENAGSVPSNDKPDQPLTESVNDENTTETAGKKDANPMVTPWNILGS